MRIKERIRDYVLKYIEERIDECLEGAVKDYIEWADIDDNITTNPNFANLVESIIDEEIAELFDE